MSEQPEEIPRNARGRIGLSALLARATRGSIDIVKAELEAYKASLVRKLKESAIGIGLFAAAGLLALFALGYLIFAIYGAFTLIVAGWLASLITAGILLVVVVVLAMLGKTIMGRHGVPDAGAAIDRARSGITEAVTGSRESAQPGASAPGRARPDAEKV